MNPSTVSLIFAIALTSAASSSWASNWVSIDYKPTNEATTYVDTDSIMVSKGLVQFLVKQSFSTPQAAGNGKSYDYLIMGTAANCQERSLAMTNGQAFSRDGTIVDSMTVPASKLKFDKVDPDTTGAQELELVCGKARSQHSTE